MVTLSVSTSVYKLKGLFLPPKLTIFLLLFEVFSCAQACPFKLLQVQTPTSGPRTLAVTVSFAVTHHLAILWTNAEFRQVAEGQHGSCPLVKNRPELCVLDFQVVYCTFFFFLLTATSRFNFIWKSSRASCDFSHYFAVPPLDVPSRDVKYLHSNVTASLLYEAYCGSDWGHFWKSAISFILFHLVPPPLIVFLLFFMLWSSFVLDEFIFVWCKVP